MFKSLLSNKFKDRKPLDTVKIITKFFESRGFTISHKMQSSEIDTWSCKVIIKMDGLEVLGANGKGMTQEFALASGYSELFERFCNRTNYINNPYFTHKIIDLEQDYFYCPEEQIIDGYQMLNSVPPVKNYFKSFLSTENNIKEFFNINYPNGAHGVPYKNLNDDNDIKYLDPSILQRALGSNGMAAGNSIEEALNQGLSELYERYGLVSFYSQPQDSYKAIDLNTVSDPDLKKAIQNILNDQYEYIVLDLSYNFSVPVLVGILIDKVGLTCHLNFSAFPVLDIAFERALTELYQGIDNFRNFYNDIETPAKMTRSSIVLNNFTNNFTEAAYLPDESLKNKITYISYQEVATNGVFISPKNNNVSILKYYMELNKKLNQKIYFYDFSLIPGKMAAVQIVATTMPSIEQIRMKNVQFTSPLLTKEVNNQFKKINQLTDGICSLVSNSENLEIKNNLINLWQNLVEDSNEAIGYIVGNLTLSTLTSPIIESQNDISSIFSVSHLLDNGNVAISNKSYLYAYQKLVATIFMYKSNFYSTKEIIAIFNNLFDKQNLDFDWVENLNNMEVILLDCYFYPTTALYNSKTYEKIVKAFIEKI